MTSFEAAISELWTAVLSQAGLVAGLLFIGYVFQTIQLIKTQNKLEAKNDQVTSLAISMIAVNKDTNSVLDKIADVVVRKE